MPDDRTPKKMTRRDFNLASFSAGLATLAAPMFAFAQEKNLDADIPISRRRIDIRPDSIPEEIQQKSQALPYNKLKLIAEVTATYTQLEIALYLMNTHDDILQVVHNTGGWPHITPTGKLLFDDAAFDLAIAVHEKYQMLVTRASSATYLDVPPAGKKATRVHYADYTSPWPDKLLKDAKKFASQKAKTTLQFEIRETGLFKREDGKPDAILTSSTTMKTPASFKKA